MNAELQKLSVRIRSSNNITIGSGLLYIAEQKEHAYVLTAAHVFDQTDYPIMVQCFPDNGVHSRDIFCFSVVQDSVVCHPKYLSASTPDEKEQYDTALIRLPRMPWMDTRAAVFFDQAHAQLKVEGFGYVSNSTQADICLDVVSFTSDESRITNTSGASHCMIALLKGDFEINHANRVQEAAGFSGTAIAAANQDQIILIGFAINIQAMNGLLGRTTLVDVYPVEELLQDEGIECAWKTIIDPCQQYPQATRTIISSTRFFVHRESELENIEQKLGQSGIVALSGIGGIGKTGLARHYASLHGNSYTQSCFIPCSGSLASGIAKYLKINGIQRQRIGDRLEDDSQLSQRILNAMRCQPENGWLLVFDDVSPRDPMLSQVTELAQHKIITSRWDLREWHCPVIDISALPDFDRQKDLFEQYLDREIAADEMDDFQAITGIVAGHTLTLQLIALQCTESDMALSEIRAALEATGIYTDNPDEFAYDESHVERNMYGHIRALWNLSGFTADENRIMQGLSLIAPSGITRREYKQWLRLGSMHDINHLRRQGWIQTYMDNGHEMIFLHAVIGDLVHRELFQECPMDLSSMFQALFDVVNDRNLNVEDQMRYISYGSNAGMRLGISENAVVLLNLTGLHLEYFRQLNEAIGLLNRAKFLVEQLMAEQSIWGGHTYNNLAAVYQTKGEYDLAMENFQKAVEIYRRCGEATQGNLGYALHNIAKLTLFRDDAEGALQIENEAEPLIRQYNITHLGEIYDVRRDCHCHLVYAKYQHHQRLTCTYRPNLILLNQVKKTVEDHMEKALVCGQLAIDYKQQYNGNNEAQIMSSLANHATNKAHYRKDPQAAADIQTVLAFFVRTTGARSIHTGHTYNKMCVIYENLGDPSRACDYGEKAVDILSSILGTNHDEVKTAVDNLQVAKQALPN